MVAETKLNIARLCQLFASWSALLAIPSGAAVTLYAGSGLSKFGGLEYVPRVASLSIVRALAGGIASSGTVLAIVHWAHPYGSGQLRKCMRSTMILGVFGSIIVSPVVAGEALLSSFIAGAGAFGITWSTFFIGVQRTVTAADCIFGLMGALASGLVLVPLIGFLLPVLARTRWRLTVKLLAVWSGLFMIGIIGRALASTP